MTDFLTPRLQLLAANLVSHRILTTTQWEATVASGECIHACTRYGYMYIYILCDKHLKFYDLTTITYMYNKLALALYATTVNTCGVNISLNGVIPSPTHLNRNYQYFLIYQRVP